MLGLPRSNVSPASFEGQLDDSVHDLFYVTGSSRDFVIDISSVVEGFFSLKPSI